MTGMPKWILETQLHIAVMYALGNIAEVPPGSNRGFWVEEFQEDAGINPGDAWCMAGVYHCHLKACGMQRVARPWLKRTGWCKGQWLYCLDQPNLTIVHAPTILQGWQIPDGAIWIRYGANGCGHTGFVYDHDPEKKELKSIEFNHSNKVDIETYTIPNIPDFKGIIC